MNIKPSQKTGEVVVKLAAGDEALLAAGAPPPEPAVFCLKKILVPVDFSDCSRKALQYAVPMARQNGSSLTLLYVGVLPDYLGLDGGGFDYGIYDPDFSAVEADLRASGQQRLDQLIAEQVPREVPCETLIQVGAPKSEILAAARNLPADLIILSTHGRTGLKHVLLGSVAEHVVREAPCPVLVVREREHEFLATKS